MRHAAVKVGYLYLLIVLLATTFLYIVSTRFLTLGGETGDSRNQSAAYSREEGQNIFFLKAHKCASSTVQNVLMRFGYWRGLDFVLPAVNNYLGNPQPFTEDMLPEELATQDGRYNATAVRRVMRPDAKFVTILRDPPQLYESLFSYYQLQRSMGGLSLETVLEDPDNARLLQRRIGNKIGLNQMSWDLGMDPEDFTNKEKVDDFVLSIDNDFDLVMISEHFPTSLVLLADLMGWSLEKVAYINLNSRPNKTRIRLTDVQRATLHHLNSADVRLYDYFYSKFHRKVLDYGIIRMMRDVKKLLSLNDRLGITCPYKNRVGYAHTVAFEAAGGGDWNCRYAVKEELQFTDEIRTRQKERVKQLKRLKRLVSNETAS